MEFPTKGSDFPRFFGAPFLKKKGIERRYETPEGSSKSGSFVGSQQVGAPVEAFTNPKDPWWFQIFLIFIPFLGR